MRRRLREKMGFRSAQSAPQGVLFDSPYASDTEMGPGEDGPPSRPPPSPPLLLAKSADSAAAAGAAALAGALPAPLSRVSRSTPDLLRTEQDEEPGRTETLGTSQGEQLDNDKLSEVKGHLEIALLEKYYLQLGRRLAAPARVSRAEEELQRLRGDSGLEAKLEKEKERRRKAEFELQRLRDENAAAATTATTATTVGASVADSAIPAPPLAEDSRDSANSASPPRGLLGPARLRWRRALAALSSDLGANPEPPPPEPDEPLSGRRLTENMRRVRRGFKPVSLFMRNLKALSVWQSVYTSAIAFVVYMYAVWHGWAVPMFLLFAIIRLSLNYLIAKGWKIHWSIVPALVIPEPEVPRDDLSVTEKFQLVLDVAQRAQNLFGKVADILEKIKNLLMWADLEATRQLYRVLWIAFVASSILPAPLLWTLFGLGLGVRAFLVAPVFHRFPSIRLKYDTARRLWQQLPTDAQRNERPALNTRRGGGSHLGRSSSAQGLVGSGSAEEALDPRRRSFHAIFSLPDSERPLPVCEGGWRCCLIQRDRRISSDYIRSGFLYVTQNYLCFENTRSVSSKKNKVISLKSITEVQKYKVLSMLPGAGMGISIKTPDTVKPLIFGAMVHRDDAYDAIMEQYSRMGPPPAPPPPPPLPLPRGPSAAGIKFDGSASPHTLPKTACKK
uniref:GRAM domain-containing protein 4 isoform X1 n=1 Tax=Petromyzon marinus TaxID=7757 RepID=A0AAJ7X5T0_PETMA|nr:GRAM domain-containing protein 4 isoform X1 [Petromyzon marinus]